MRPLAAQLAATALVGLALGALGPAPSRAEESDDDGARGSVEEMTVVGDERAEADVLAGASMVSFDADSGLLEGVRLEELLEGAPGLQIRNFGGAGEPVEISIRGSSAQQVPVFLDGVRLESSLTSRTDLSTICLDVLEAVQVTRGPGAALERTARRTGAL